MSASTHDSPTGPGVRFPPPFLYAIPGLLGYVVHRRAPWPLVPASLREPAEVVGLAFAAIALCTIGWAISRFLLARTSILPHRPANAFVASGPYRFTRNPMYVSLAMLLLGLALMADSLWMGVAVPVGMLLVQRLVIRREEAYLTARFGHTYVDYARRVPRWL